MQRWAAIARTRWAAIGAAVAVTLGAGGLGLVDAAKSSGVRAVYTALDVPCRIADTRSTSTVGAKSTPMGPAEVHTVTVRGTNGECVGIPDDAVAVGLNVTALGATLPTHLTFWAGPTSPVPNASSMNPVPGRPATPNAVTVDLDDVGAFHLFNLQGNVDVIIDVVGIYQDHHHDDRYYTRATIDSKLGVKAGIRDVYTRAQVDEMLAAQRVVASSRRIENPPPLPAGVNAVIAESTIDVPVTGLLQIVGSVNLTASASPDAVCWLLVDGIGALPGTSMTVPIPGRCVVNGAVEVAAGSYDVRLFGGAENVSALAGANLDVLFVPGGTLTS
jgi:hypothetical protein